MTRETTITNETIRMIYTMKMRFGIVPYGDDQ